MRVNSYSEIPVSADALMYEEEETEGEAQSRFRMPSEAELLDQIFGDRPKQHTMSSGAKASAQTFSINLSASEVTSVRDEEMPAPAASAPKKAVPPAKSEGPAEKLKKKTKKKEEAKEPAPPKKVQRIVSPDEFFGDDTSPVGRRMKSMKVDTPVIEEDAAFEAQLAALERGEKKKKRRYMPEADMELEDAHSGIDDPAVAAAAQAILEEEGIIPSDGQEETADAVKTTEAAETPVTTEEADSVAVSDAEKSAEEQ